jgi:hypothetical protein
MLPRSSLFRSLLLSLAVTFGLLSAALAGPVRDGNYTGQLQCSAMIGNPSNAGWTSPVQLQVAGDTVLWQRGNGQFSESAQVRWSRGGFDIDALGAWSPASRKQGRWRTVGSLRLEGNAVTGAMRQISAAGDQVFRQCNVNIPVTFAVATRTAQQPAPLPQPPHDPVRAQATEDCAWKGGAACANMLNVEARAQANDASGNASTPRTGGDLRRPPVANTGAAGVVAMPPTGQAVAPQAPSTVEPLITQPAPAKVPGSVPFDQPGATGQQPTTPISVTDATPAPMPVAAEASRAAAAPTADIGSARRYIAAGTFGSYWILWVIVGAVLTLYLPLSFLLANPAGAISQLSFMNLLDIFNRTGKIRPYAAEAQSWAMMGLLGLAMLVTGPLIIWFNAGVPWVHTRDGANTTICCVERPEYTDDKRFAIDLYRDDPFLPWYMIKAILTSKANGPWKLRVLDIERAQFVDLRGFGKTEDQGSTLVLDHNEKYLKTQTSADRLRIMVEREPVVVVDIPASGVGLRRWPTNEGQQVSPYTAIKKGGNVTYEAQDAVRRAVAAFPVADVTDAGARTPLLLAREKPDNDGLLGALKGLWSLVADWQRFAWVDANTGQVRKTVTLFGNARHAGSTPDGGAHVFVATGGYLKVVRTAELRGGD